MARNGSEETENMNEIADRMRGHKRHRGRFIPKADIATKGEDRCDAASVTQDHCSLSSGHVGPHAIVRVGTNQILFVWPNDAPPTYREGDFLPPDLLWDGTPGADCTRIELALGFACTRLRDHDGQHVATIGAGYIVHVWGE